MGCHLILSFSGCPCRDLLLLLLCMQKSMHWLHPLGVMCVSPTHGGAWPRCQDAQAEMPAQAARAGHSTAEVVLVKGACVDGCRALLHGVRAGALAGAPYIAHGQAWLPPMGPL